MSLIWSSTSLMSWMVLASASLSFSIWPSSLSIFAWFFFTSHLMLAMVLFVFLYSSLHWSRLAMSEASSSLRVFIMSSTASMTSWKWPTLASRAFTARAARRKLFAFVAAAFSEEYALSSGLSADTCSREGAPVSMVGSAPVSLPGLIALMKRSRASSSLRMLRALMMPSSSSSRISLLVTHSLCLASQAALVSSKSAMSAFFWAMVSS
mmetsp:Transcript_1120/g.3415  ORF Transcript_1120/g.3415 Transcript_1120/m.3415 type:complete len:209 (-) Transcript_1120:895-1521(-)